MSIKRVFIAVIFIVNFSLTVLSAPVNDTIVSNGGIDRAIWLQTMLKIADPVLQNLANSSLKKNMPYEFSLDSLNTRKKYAYLECLGRTFCGIAPWLELGPDKSTEGKIREYYISLSLKALKNSVDPNSPDYINFSTGNQSLVDAAYLSLGFLRAPNQIWKKLDKVTQERFIYEIKKTRLISPAESNWLLFASMVEAMLLKFTGECNMPRLKYGVDRFFNDFYIGDGMYGDGLDFHMDYYNSYVIHPMLTKILLVLKKNKLIDSQLVEIQLRRQQRLVEVLERMISPEGTYPLIGRTISCRMGSFHALSQAALLHILPHSIQPEQVRSALTSVMKNQFSGHQNFDKSGWLQIGFNGKQVALGESYVNTGSLYHTMLVFLPLGLPESDEFWQEPFSEWSSLKAWAGKKIIADHPLKEYTQRTIFQKVLDKVLVLIPFKILIMLGVVLTLIIGFMLGIIWVKRIGNKTVVILN